MPTAILFTLYYAGFGFALLLAWIGLLPEAMATHPSRWVRPATDSLAVVGLAHPAAALVAWDLRRELDIDRADPNGRPGRGRLAPVIASLVIAAGVVVGTGLT